MTQLAGIIRNQSIELPHLSLAPFEGRKVLVTILDQAGLQPPSKNAEIPPAFADASILSEMKDFSNNCEEITDELIMQRRAVLRSRCCVSRSEWAQGDIDALIRKDRDEDRF